MKCIDHCNTQPRHSQSRRHGQGITEQGMAARLDKPKRALECESVARPLA